MADRLYRAVVDHVLTRLATEDLKPGDPLPTERELGASLGVSRNVLREGFRILEERGLVVTRQGSGRYVRELPVAGQDGVGLELERLEKASIADVLEARFVIEERVVALACARRTIAEAQRLCQLAEHHRDWQDNVAFHVGVAKLTHNFVFERLIQSQLELLGELHQRTHYPTEVADLLSSQHQDLAAAVLNRDEARARELIREHLAATRLGVDGDRPPGIGLELAGAAIGTWAGAPGVPVQSMHNPHLNREGSP